MWSFIVGMMVGMVLLAVVSSLIVGGRSDENDHR